MNLGQTLIVVLALVLFSTIVVSLNRLKVDATEGTIEQATFLDAINYGQSIMEAISKNAATQHGYNSLQSRTLSPFTTATGETIFASVQVDDSGLQQHNVVYKNILVSVYSDSSMTSNVLLSEYRANFTDWWNN